MELVFPLKWNFDFLLLYFPSVSLSFLSFYSFCFFIFFYSIFYPKKFIGRDFRTFLLLSDETIFSLFLSFHYSHISFFNFQSFLYFLFVFLCISQTLYFFCPHSKIKINLLVQLLSKSLIKLKKKS